MPVMSIPAQDWMAAHLLLDVLLASVPGVLAAGHALLHKRDPRSAMGWVLLCLVLPVAGAIAYMAFGRNRIRRTARRRRARRQGGSQRRALEAAVAALVPGYLQSLDRLAGAITQRELLAGNQVGLLTDGESAYAAMIAAIDGASEQVLLASYIFDARGVGERFVGALARAVQRGVEVRVLVDAIGEWYSWPRIVPCLRAAGVPTARFNPVSWLSLVAYLNLRNHRKILVVDGREAFTGGMNIRNHHVASAGSGELAEDLHFSLRGPIARDLARLFADDWRFVSDLPVQDLAVVPPGDGHSLCRMVEDGPDNNLDKLTRLVFGAINHARGHICIMTPYFLPPREIMLALQNAALRGVEVKILLPEKNNLRFVDWASRHILAPLLQSGVRIFLYRENFLHAKLLAVDGCYLQVGSHNLDMRSLRLNFELGVEVYDPQVCQQAEAFFAGKLALARELHEAELTGRSLPVRLRDAALWLLSPYL